MRFNRRRGNLSLMSVTKGKIYRMSQERQRVSFIIVIVFMAIFGMIVLAEVLNISLDNTRNAPDVLYDDEDNVVVADAAATPGLIFVRTFFAQKGKCSSFIELTPTL